MVRSDPSYEKELNCLVSDLVGGIPPVTNGDKTIEEGSWMYVYTAEDETGILDSIYKMVFGHWKKRV